MASTPRARIIGGTVENNICSLKQTFANLRAARRIGLLPFIPAGFPDLDATKALLPALQRGGASAIEIGFPFSDPVADGPTIQQAFTTALANKIKVSDILAAIAAVRPQLTIPLLAMVSYSIVFRFGAQRFFQQAHQSGFNAVIIPDLPPPEAQPICAQAQAAGLDTVLLISPTTALERRREIAQLCSGFIYYLSVSGITGAREQLPDDMQQNLKQLRNMTQVPVCVGFGISKREHMDQLTAYADGAIVGSALVKCIAQHQQQGITAMANAAQEYCQQLLSPL